VTPPVRIAHVATVDMTVRFLLLPQLRRLHAAGYDVTAISAPGPWVGEIEADGVRHVAWPHATRAWNPLSDARAFVELVQILRRGRFDVVHTHNPKPGVLGRVAARAAGVPCVVNTVHGFFATRESPLSKRLMVLTLERAAALLSDLEFYQSEEDLAWARRRSVVPTSKGILLRNGTDVEWFDPRRVRSEHLEMVRAELGIAADAVVVGTVGRLVAEKGYRELFEAARAVRATNPNVRFLVVGEPDAEKPDAITKAELRQAAEDVVFAGWRTDVRDMLALMDVFVSASWREGVPRSVIEAASMARALVLTDIRGCREVAREGIEALLVPARRPDRLAEQIRRLVSDSDLRGRLGRAARARVEERFDERLVVDTIARRYRELLDRKGIQAPYDDATRQGWIASRTDHGVLATLQRNQSLRRKGVRT
jgi:glycosyltransferase involved in cell wall biosynthesis